MKEKCAIFAWDTVTIKGSTLEDLGLNDHSCHSAEFPAMMCLSG